MTAFGGPFQKLIDLETGGIGHKPVVDMNLRAGRQVEVFMFISQMCEKGFDGTDFGQRTGAVASFQRCASCLFSQFAEMMPFHERARGCAIVEIADGVESLPC